MPENNASAPPTQAAQPASAPIAPEELVALYQLLYEREWNINAFRNPITVMRSLLHYGRLAAARLADAHRRIEALAGRVLALEDFRKSTEMEAGEAMKQLEAMMVAAAPVAAPVAVAPPPPTALAAVPAEAKLEEPKTDETKKAKKERTA